jgi:mono/diheme cytochrome c family protein
MKRMVLRALIVLGVLIVVGVVGGGLWVSSQVRAFDASMARVYDIPIPTVTRSTDPLVIARGEHLARSLGGCIACHGEDLAGGKVEELGPLGRIVHVNLTPGKNGVLAAYSDGELARLLRHGVKRDGRSVNMMPAFEFFWWPDSDRDALISYLRTLPAIDAPPPVVEFATMAKVLDRQGAIPIDVARRVDHEAAPSRIAPAPTAEYGAELAHICKGCHGDKHMAGGPIPGAPPDFPPPPNLTPHETGLKAWSYEDFEKMMETGARRDGAPLSAFMPVVSLRNMNEVERRAIWAYLRSLPPVPFGER